jgi:hypothetical protein
MDWSPRIVARGRPRGWHRPMAMGMGYPAATIVTVTPPPVVETYDFHVAVGGTNSSGTPGTLGSPFGSIEYALGRANAALTGTGKVIAVRGGTYTPASFGPGNYYGTSWTNRIRVVNYNGESVIYRSPLGTQISIWPWDMRYVEWQGLTIDGSNCFNYTMKLDGPGTHHTRWISCEFIGPAVANLSANPSGSTIVSYTGASDGGYHEFWNCTVHGGGDPTFGDDHAFYLGTANNLIDGCNIYDFAGAGVQLWNEGNSTMNHHNIVRNCYIHDGQSAGGSESRGYGIVTGGSTNQFYNNVIVRVNFANHGTGMGIGLYACDSCVAVNNTIAECNGAAVTASGSTGNFRVQNNISRTNAGDYVPTPSEIYGLNVIDHNSWDAPVSGQNPQFINAAGGNYRLTNPGSPCIGQGTPLGSILITDKDGNPRTVAWDQGAYETS